MSVLIVRNIPREGPGLLEKLLVHHRTPFEIVDAHTNLPDPTKYKAVVVLGGPASANDQNPVMQAELDMIKKAVGANMPYLGICLGMQTLVRANGGSVYKNEVPEIGWRALNAEYFTIDITRTGESDPLFAELPKQIGIFHLHGETVMPTEAMQVLATGKYCHVQAVRVGDNAYGIQGHLELTKDLLETWITNDPDLRQLNPIALRQDYKTLRERYNATGRQLFTNFLRIARLC